MTSIRATRRLAAPIALVAGAMLALMGFAGPAAAHDSLSGSNPAADASVEQAPESVVLDYSANLIDAGTEVLVTGESGETVSTGAAVVVGAQVTQALEPELPAGTYTVTWRVVSSDGHPIDGTYRFTVEVGVPVEAATPEPSETPEPEMTTQTAPDAEDGAEDDGPIEGSAGNDQTPWIGVVGALVGIGVLAAAIFLITRALRKTKA